MSRTMQDMLKDQAAAAENFYDAVMALTKAEQAKKDADAAVAKAALKFQDASFAFLNAAKAGTNALGQELTIARQYLIGDYLVSNHGGCARCERQERLK